MSAYEIVASIGVLSFFGMIVCCTAMLLGAIWESELIFKLSISGGLVSVAVFLTMLTLSAGLK
jgi:hypothetical protein